MKKFIVALILFILVINYKNCFASNDYSVQLNNGLVQMQKKYSSWQNIEYKLMNDTNYIKISSFNNKTYEQVLFITDVLKENGVTKLIVDLRYNFGGTIYDAIETAGIFCSKGEIATIYLDNEQSKTFYCENEKPLLKLIILTNAMTASSAELFTAACIDSKIAISVGVTSYGKTSIQSVYKDDKGELKFQTVGKYLTRDKKDISYIGIEPTFKIKNEYVDGIEKDYQLDKALELIKKGVDLWKAV